MVRSKVRYLQSGSNYDERLCFKSVWAYSQLIQFLSTVKKIPKDLSARIDDLVQSATLGTDSTGHKHNANDLPDFKINCSKNIPTLRYITLKFRMQWSEIIALIIEDCISNTDCVDKWKKLFAVSKILLFACIKGGKMHKQRQQQQQQENSKMNRFVGWRSGKYAALRYEAASMKQAKNKSNNTMEALASRASTLCLQGLFGRAAMIFLSEGIARDNRKVFR